MEDLLTLKTAMWDTATELAKSNTGTLDLNDQDKLSRTMAFIRAAEGVNLNGMSKACKDYPFLRTLVNPNDPNTRVSTGIQEARNHALALARRAQRRHLTTRQLAGRPLLSTPSPQKNTNTH